MVPRSLFWFLSVAGIFLPCRFATSVEYDAKIPQLAFAEQELTRARTEAEREELAPKGLPLFGRPSVVSFGA
jgi:hypothetical protein